jgi:hypothetical protein
MRLKSVLLIALLLPKLGVAGGSIGPNQMDVLMAQMPEIREFLRSTLMLSDGAYAEIRLGPSFMHLSGAQVGPYQIEATSLKDGKPLLVVLCTKSRFLDAKGRELPGNRIEQAVRIEEKLEGVLLRKAGNVNASSLC